MYTTPSTENLAPAGSEKTLKLTVEGDCARTAGINRKAAKTSKSRFECEKMLTHIKSAESGDCFNYFSDEVVTGLEVSVFFDSDPLLLSEPEDFDSPPDFDSPDLDSLPAFDSPDLESPLDLESPSDFDSPPGLFDPFGPEPALA